MSPLRKKGRGGGGGKIMAPRSSPQAANHSPDPLVPLKLTRERRASTTQLNPSSKSKQLKAEAPARVSAVDQAKADQSRISTSDQEQARIISSEEDKRLHPGETRASSSIRTRVQAAEQVCTSSLSQLRINAAEQSKGFPTTQPSKVSATDKVRSSSATRSRVSSVENFRSLIASSRGVPVTAGDSSSGTHGSSRRMSTKLRAESRPRSNRASPGTSIPSKFPSERVSAETSKTSTLALLARAKLTSNTKEDNKKLVKTSTFPACNENSKVEPSCSEKAPSREPLRNLKNSSQGEACTETLRLSTTTLPLSAQGSRKGNPGDAHALQDGACCTKPGKDRQQHGRLSTGLCNLPVSNTMKYTCDAGTVDSRVLLKCRNAQDMVDENSVSGLILQSRPEATSNVSISLHRRLVNLEGKVCELASEIQKTREMLTSGRCTSNADLLIDVQDKITSMEKFMSCSESSNNTSNVEKDVNMEDHFQVQVTDNVEASRPSLEYSNAENHLHSSQVPIVSEHEFYFKYNVLQGPNSAPPKVSGLMYDPRQGRACIYSHRTLLRNRLPLQERELQTSSDIMPLESTAGRESVNPTTDNQNSRIACNLANEQVQTDSTQHPNVQENMASFGHGQLGFEQATSTEEPLACAEDAKDVLECSESPISDNFPENVENVAPNDEVYFDYDDSSPNQLHPIGDKVATAGWYVSEGESILLAHDDGCCSYHDVANMEEKAVYSAPSELASTLWNDCWLIRAAGSDGRASKYIVAATAGNALDCGFCSWDFFSKRLAACHTENQSTPPRGSSPGSPIQRSLYYSLQLPSVRSATSLTSSGGNMLRSQRVSIPFGTSNMQKMDTLLHHSATSYQTESCESPQWWYRPCGPLMASAASSSKALVLYDIRDGDAVMSWESDQPIANLDYSSPLQWRDKGKVALAEHEGISVWDVSTMDMQCLQYVQLPGKRISAFYVHNADAECSGGVRQRLSSSETEAYDGICCTQNDINVLDFRVPNGVGVSFSVSGQDMQSVYARGDMIFVGGLNKESHECGVQQWSLRRGLVRACAFPASSSHYTHLALTQVWGSSRMVMAVNGNGLYIFQGWREATEGVCDIEEVKDVIGTQDLLNPSFDYSNSRVLLISRDRPANWSYWPQHWGMP